MIRLTQLELSNLIGIISQVSLPVEGKEANVLRALIKKMRMMIEEIDKPPALAMSEPAK